MQHLLFAGSSRRQTLVLEGVEVPVMCAASSAGGGGGGNSSLLIGLSKQLNLMGEVQRMQVTPNGQYVFTSLRRQRWELAAMERAVQVCQRLKEQPEDPFLAPYRSSCAGKPAPRMPKLEDFLQIASVCPPTQLCPRF